MRVRLFGTADRRLINAIRRHIRKLSPVIGNRLQPGFINIIFTSNAYIRELNRRYLKRNRPTDVLAFPLNLKEKPGQFLVGEIYISRDQARHQARAAGRRIRDEVLFLVRHGLFHLAGFSHQEMNRLP
jgi:probable rRNA maturation factor